MRDPDDTPDPRLSFALLTCASCGRRWRYPLPHRSGRPQSSKNCHECRGMLIELLKDFIAALEPDPRERFA